MRTVFTCAIRYDYTTNKAGWKYSSGRVTEQMLREHLPAPSASGEVLALVCGPPGFVKESCVPMLGAIGFRKEDIFLF